MTSHNGTRVEPKPPLFDVKLSTVACDIMKSEEWRNATKRSLRLLGRGSCKASYLMYWPKKRRNVVLKVAAENSHCVHNNIEMMWEATFFQKLLRNQKYMMTVHGSCITNNQKQPNANAVEVLDGNVRGVVKRMSLVERIQAIGTLLELFEYLESKRLLLADIKPEQFAWSVEEKRFKLVDADSLIFLHRALGSQQLCREQFDCELIFHTYKPIYGHSMPGAFELGCDQEQHHCRGLSMHTQTHVLTTTFLTPLLRDVMEALKELANETWTTNRVRILPLARSLYNQIEATTNETRVAMPLERLKLSEVRRRLVGPILDDAQRLQSLIPSREPRLTLDHNVTRRMHPYRVIYPIISRPWSCRAAAVASEAFSMSTTSVNATIGESSRLLSRLRPCLPVYIERRNLQLLDQLNNGELNRNNEKTALLMMLREDIALAQKKAVAESNRRIVVRRFPYNQTTSTFNHIYQQRFEQEIELLTKINPRHLAALPALISVCNSTVNRPASYAVAAYESFDALCEPKQRRQRQIDWQTRLSIVGSGFAALQYWANHRPLPLFSLALRMSDFAVDYATAQVIYLNIPQLEFRSCIDLASSDVVIDEKTSCLNHRGGVECLPMVVERHGADCCCYCT